MGENLLPLSYFSEESILVNKYIHPPDQFMGKMAILRTGQFVYYKYVGNHDVT